MEEQKFFIKGKEKFVPPVNDSPYKRILAIGDIHGQLERLEALWEKISVTDDDLVIFLGDYTVGNTEKTNNMGTLNWLAEKTLQKNIVALMGNTDYEILKLIERHDLETPPKILKFLKNLPHSCQIKIGGRDYFFCHCGVNPDKSLDAQSKSQLIGLDDYEKFYLEYAGATRIIVGHKSPKKILKTLPELFPNDTSNIDPIIPLKIPNKNILMLDTRAKDNDGRLTCADVLSGQYWQS